MYSNLCYVVGMFITIIQQFLDLNLGLPPGYGICVSFMFSLLVSRLLAKLKYICVSYGSKLALMYHCVQFKALPMLAIHFNIL